MTFNSASENLIAGIGLLILALFSCWVILECQEQVKRDREDADRD